jgi:hypothetical protein
VLTFFESTFTGSNTADRLRNGQRTILSDVMTRLRSTLDTLNLEFRQHTFIPPGGGVLSFQNPTFSLQGDLLFDVVAKD